MKKYLIIGLVCICAVFGLRLLFSGPAVSTLSDTRLRNMCNEITTELAKNESHLYFQYGEEELCVCMAKKMPDTINEREFRKIFTNRDNTVDEIVDECLEMQMKYFFGDKAFF